MQSVWMLVVNSLLLGAGLAMDAFSVSLVNGLNEPRMKKARMCVIAGTFAGFQTAMPLIGWICVRTVAEHFQAVHRFVPWIGMVLLLYIGGKMLWEGLRGKAGEESKETTAGSLLLQGIATSIDALSVGFTMADARPLEAVAEALIIGAVTFVICLAGIFIGRKAGMKLADKATVLGGVILIGIAIEIFVTHML